MAESQEIDETKDLCTVCQEFLEGRHWTRLTPCGHPFHVTCIIAWFEVRQKRTCPSCRETAHPPGGAPTVDPLQTINGSAWEIEQHDMWQRLEVHDKEVAAAAEEAHSKQIAYKAAQLAKEHVDETTEPCVICHQPLGLQYWVRLHACRHTLHSACGVRSFLQQRLNKSCPECREMVRPPAGPAPIVEADLLITINNHESEVDEWMMWHALKAVEKNEDEKQTQWKLRKIGHSRLDKARQSQQKSCFSWPAIFQSSEQKQAEELVKAQREEVEECYLCEQPLGQAYWTRLRSSECEHSFHTGCIVHHFVNDGNPRVDCPLCYKRITPPPLPPGFESSSIKTIHEYSNEVPEFVLRYLVRYQLDRHQAEGDAALLEGDEESGHLVADEFSVNCAICNVVLGSRSWATLPSCRHSFHTSCLAAWFFFGGVMLCPQCGFTAHPPDDAPPLSVEDVITPINGTQNGLVSHAIWVALAFLLEGADVEDAAVEELVGRAVLERARTVRGPRGDPQRSLAGPSSRQYAETATIDQNQGQRTLVSPLGIVFKLAPADSPDREETPQVVSDHPESSSRVRPRAENSAHSSPPNKKMKEKVVADSSH